MKQLGLGHKLESVFDEDALAKVRRDVGPKGHAEVRYDWYDINVTQNIVRKKRWDFCLKRYYK